jgi:hypothetical protein
MPTPACRYPCLPAPYKNHTASNVDQALQEQRRIHDVPQLVHHDCANGNEAAGAQQWGHECSQQQRTTCCKQYAAVTTGVNCLQERNNVQQLVHVVRNAYE